MQDWETIERGIRIWLAQRASDEDRHRVLTGRARATPPRGGIFPIGYTGSGVDDDMWLDKNYLRQLIAKSKRPTSDCTLPHHPVHEPGRAAMSTASPTARFLSTGQLVARQAGTVIATGHMTAGVTYWR